jgi:hypothetical protein
MATWAIDPDLTEEREREALVAAIERALAEENGGPAGYGSRWWRAGLEDLGGGPAAEQAGREPRVVEP